MKEIIGDLFDPNTYQLQVDDRLVSFNPDAICITTNGFIKANGQCVMGRGCAKTAATIYPDLPSRLGSYINQYGNRVFDMGKCSYWWYYLVTFPVKCIRERCNETKTNVVKHMQSKFNPGDWVPGWACVADETIIKRSAQQLTELADKRDWGGRIVLPRPGAGAGELNWEDVKKVIEPILDDRFHVITFPRR